MPNIQDLLVALRDERNESWRDMERRAAGAGHRVKHQTLTELGKAPPKTFPREMETIRAIAYLTGTTEKAVILAFAKSLGVDVDVNGESALAELMPAGADRLSPRMQTAFLGMIRAAIAETEEVPAGLLADIDRPDHEEQEVLRTRHRRVGG